MPEKWKSHQTKTTQQWHRYNLYDIIEEGKDEDEDEKELNSIAKLKFVYSNL